MNVDWFLLSLATAVALRGLGAGMIAGLSLMLPVRGRIGLVPYAQATRALYRGSGVRVYGAATVLGASLNAGLTIAAFGRGEPAVVSWLLAASLACTTLGFVGTARNLPVMIALWATPDADAARLALLLNRWARWHVVGVASHVAAFVIIVVALARA